MQLDWRQIRLEHLAQAGHKVIVPPMTLLRDFAEKSSVLLRRASLRPRAFFLEGLALGLATAFAAHAGKSADGKNDQEAVSFNRSIQPILAEYCSHCHGPDSASRKPKKHPLRLDRSDFAFEVRDNGKPVIVPGDPSTSEIIRRIRSPDPGEVMPPPSERKTLKPGEIAVLEKWVSQGAKYENHWSLIPPTRPPVPKAGTSAARNPIDAFVAAKLKESGLKLNPQEQKARLFRRLCFDLTGLPPSPADLHVFLQNHSADAYEKTVDRLLASDACAEQFARHWLDAVRYADTQGIHHDHSRTIWPYRDWVIRAFKSNMPFDEFTVEQLAGDLIPNASIDQLVASGYNRLLPTTGEGGAIPEEYQAIYAKDRVDTTAAVWLGLTTGCATCHDHKFDPITTRDFYSLTAFFRNNTTHALDDHTSADTPPLLFVPADVDRERWKELESSVAVKERELSAQKEQARSAFQEWLAAAAAKITPPDLEDASFSILLAGTNTVAGGQSDGLPVQWKGAHVFRQGPFGAAPLLEAGEAVSGHAPNLNREGAFSYGGWVFIEGKPSGAVISRMDRAEEYRGWDLLLTEGKPTVHIIDRYPGEALKVTAAEALKPGMWHHVMAIFDGRRTGAGAVTLYIDGEVAAAEINNNSLGKTIATRAPLRLGGRSDREAAIDTIQNGKVYAQDLRIYERALPLDQVARLAAGGLAADLVQLAEGDRSASRTNRLFEAYLNGFDERFRILQSEMAGLKAQQGEVRSRGAVTLIMGEAKDREPVAWVLTRGNYASKGDRVGAAVPAFLPAMKSDLPRNRLGLGRWLAARENPLTARVTVNRLWADLFGTGIVETTEDFGVMGSRPSNQELLDWLASEFMDSGWDYRHMVKLMVMSATYRQSATVSPRQLEKDPLNKLASRGPHLRLDAEQIRDQALAASGLLVTKVGGPPVRPYQPEGIWETVAMKVSNTSIYKQDTGDSLYRRSMYTFWKRTAPPPSMEILNAPTRDVFCTRRERTDTPLQALVTMNDPQLIEAARALAARACRTSARFDDRLDAISESLMARRFNASERKMIRSMHDRALAVFNRDQTAAKSLLAVGDSKADATLPPLELAAWTMVASEVMNLDESLTK